MTKRNIVNFLQNSVTIFKIKIMNFKLDYVCYLFPFFWILFFNDKIQYNFGDWYFTSLLKAYQVSFSLNSFPYEVAILAKINDVGEKILFDQNFLSILWLPISPQILLLKYISIENFLFFQIFLVSIISIKSFLLWKKKLKFSTHCLLLITPSWIFGGFVVTRFAVGHWMFVGFLLIPLLFYILYNLIICNKINNDNKKKLKNSIYLAFVLSFTLMQGHVHFIYHVVILTLLISFCFLDRIKYLIFSFIIFILISLPTLLPKIFFSNQSLEYIKSNRLPESGYGPSLLGNSSKEFNFNENNFLIFIFKNIKNFILLIIKSPDYENNIWEKTLYLSLATTTFCFFGFYNFFKKFKLSKNNIKIIIIFTLFSLFSVYNFHYWFVKFFQFFFYFPAIDRVSAKFFLYSLFFILILLAPQADKTFIKNKTIYFFLILISYYQLLNNLNKWSLKNSTIYFPKIENNLTGSRADNLILDPDIKILNSLNLKYIYVFNISILFSIIFLFLLFFLIFKLKKK
jgi:hypothetical protein